MIYVPYNTHSKVYGEQIENCPALQDVTQHFLETERELCSKGRARQPYRMLCVTKQFSAEWESVLSQIVPRDKDEREAKAQVVDILAAYCAGECLAYPEQTHTTDPDHCFCWEIKTPDVRVYGWYVEENFFIAAKLADANKTHGSKGYKEVSDIMLEIKQFREKLSVPFCNHVKGKRSGHVLSNRVD